MSNQTDISDNVLGITDVVETTTREVTPPKPVLVPTTTGTDEDIDNDYKYQRENFYNLMKEDRMQLMVSRPCKRIRTSS